MSYEARVFRLLIASPSDVEEERDIAVKTIQEWNDLNSAERQIVLLPLRWETHTAPEYGKRPQEIINKQIVDHCDLLIGIFWTRIGSPTGVEDSGTLEEINCVASAGKPVMLYFSKVKKAPDEINIEQLAQLRDFKTSIFNKALIETYNSQIEFRDKLSKQIEIQLRNLLLADNNKEIGKITCDIILEFADLNYKKNLGTESTIKSIYFNLSDIDNIPDFTTDKDEKRDDNQNIIVFGTERANKDYYREMAEYLVAKNMFKPFSFWLKNLGNLGAKELYIDITVSSSINDVKLISSDKFNIKKPKKYYHGGVQISEHTIHYGPLDYFITEEKEGKWKITLQLRALQPKREICTDFQLVVGARQSGEIFFDATIYADSLPEPIHQHLILKLDVEVIDIDAKSFIQKYGNDITMQDY